MSPNILPPSTCSGTTCSPSSTPSPPLPHQQSTFESILDDQRYSPNGLQARGRVVRCYLQICYIATEPDSVSTTVVATDTLIPTILSPSPSHTSSLLPGSTPLPLNFTFTDTTSSKTEATSASTSSSDWASGDAAKATVSPRATSEGDSAEPVFGTATAITSSMPALADAPITSSLPALDVVTTSSDNVSLSTPNPTSSSNPSTGSTPRSGLSAAAIARIAIGAGVGAGFLAIALICLVARWRNKRRAARLAAARRKPFAGSEAYGMASRSESQAEDGRGGLGRASSDSNTVVDHDGHGGEEFGMAGGAHGRKDRERV